jgi:hypothetical protein
MRGWSDFAERRFDASAKSPKNQVMISKPMNAFLFLTCFLRRVRKATEPALRMAVVQSKCFHDSDPNSFQNLQCSILRLSRSFARHREQHLALLSMGHHN